MCYDPQSSFPHHSWHSSCLAPVPSLRSILTLQHLYAPISRISPHRTLCAAWLSRATPLHIYTTRPAPAALAPLQIWPTIGDVGVHSPHHFEPAFDRLRRQVGLARRFYRPPPPPALLRRAGASADLGDNRRRRGAYHPFFQAPFRPRTPPGSSAPVPLPHPAFRPAPAALALFQIWPTPGDVGVHPSHHFEPAFDRLRCLVGLARPLYCPPASRPLASRWRLPGSGRQHGTSGCIPPFLSSLPSPPHAPGLLALAPLPHPPLPGPPPPR
ncbi:hypothetical protein DFH09DRAFT_1304896 [Mycena vulgaris]|nr:hypothetical protein DFH09DRAFT_1304896 [Mycena vulgaris]